MRDHNYKLPLGGVAGLETSYRNRSKMLGYDVSLTEHALASLATQQLNAGKLQDRVKTYRRAIELFPKSADMYDRLGDALAAGGDIENARTNVSIAVRLSETANDGRANEYRKHLESITRR
jgi:Flp pilus assembly protein TadD